MRTVLLLLVVLASCVAEPPPAERDGDTRFTVFQASAPPEELASFSIPERCHNGFDDDGDGRVDCQDPDCAMDRACRPADLGHCAVDCTDEGCDVDPDCAGSWCMKATYDAGSAVPVDIHQQEVPVFQPRYWAGIDNPWGDMWVARWTAPADGDYVFSSSSINPRFTDLYDETCPQDLIKPVATLWQRRLYRLRAGESVLAVFEDGLDALLTRFSLHIDAKADSETDCFDGYDNDMNGRTDCDDPACSSDPRCAGLACADADAGAVSSVDFTGPARTFDDGWTYARLVWTAPRTGRYLLSGVAEHPDCDSLSVQRDRCDGPTLVTAWNYCTVWCGVDYARTSALFTAGERVVVTSWTMDKAARIRISPWAPETPESCQNGTDPDGDGRVGCEDFDCLYTGACGAALPAPGTAPMRDEFNAASAQTARGRVAEVLPASAITWLRHDQLQYDPPQPFPWYGFGSSVCANRAVRVTVKASGFRPFLGMPAPYPSNRVQATVGPMPDRFTGVSSISITLKGAGGYLTVGSLAGTGEYTLEVTPLSP